MSVILTEETRVLALPEAATGALELLKAITSSSARTESNIAASPAAINNSLSIISQSGLLTPPSTPPKRKSDDEDDRRFHAYRLAKAPRRSAAPPFKHAGAASSHPGKSSAPDIPSEGKVWRVTLETEHRDPESNDIEECEYSFGDFTTLDEAIEYALCVPAGLFYGAGVASANRDAITRAYDDNGSPMCIIEVDFTHWYGGGDTAFVVVARSQPLH